MSPYQSTIYSWIKASGGCVGGACCRYGHRRHCTPPQPLCCCPANPKPNPNCCALASLHHTVQARCAWTQLHPLWASSSASMSPSTTSAWSCARCGGWVGWAGAGGGVGGWGGGGGKRRRCVKLTHKLMCELRVQRNFAGCRAPAAAAAASAASFPAQHSKLCPLPPLHPLPPPGVAQVCNHPMLSYSSSSSSYEPGENIVRQCGKFLVLDRLLVKMKLSGHRCTLCMLRALACAVHACGCMSMPALCCVLRTHTYIYVYMYICCLLLHPPEPAQASLHTACLPACPACCPPLPEPCALPACRPALTHAPLPPARPLIAAGCSCSAP